MDFKRYFINRILLASFVLVRSFVFASDDSLKPIFEGSEEIISEDQQDKHDSEIVDFFAERMDTDLLYLNQLDEVVNIENLKHEDNGGAVSANDIHIASCKDIVVLDCSTNVDISSLSDPYLLIGGGAFHSKNSIELTKNIGAISFQRNKANLGCGGALSGKDIFFGANQGKLLFHHNTALTGGAISALDKVVISGNIRMVLASNTALKELDSSNPDYFIHGGGAIATAGFFLANGNDVLKLYKNTSMSCGGGILAKKVSLVSNDNIYLDQNVSKFAGGAIAVKDACFFIDNNKTSVLGNRATCFGGGVFCLGDIVIKENSFDTDFLHNTVYGCLLDPDVSDSQVDERRLVCGGAIAAKNSVVIENNVGPVKLAYNSAKHCGGAIFVGDMSLDDNYDIDQLASSGSVAIRNNSGLVSISYNTTDLTFETDGICNKVGGGGIYTKYLDIVDNQGGVIFSFNQSCSGGAIKIANNGYIRLVASGNKGIQFFGNTNGSRQKDGIFLSGSTAFVKELSAEDDSFIHFQEPFVYEILDTRNEPLIINQKGNATSYKGTIGFFGVINKIPQGIYLDDGKLLLAQESELWINSFYQKNKDSLLIMHGGTCIGPLDRYQESQKEAFDVEMLDNEGDIDNMLWDDSDMAYVKSCYSCNTTQPNASHQRSLTNDFSFKRIGLDISNRKQDSITTIIIPETYSSNDLDIEIFNGDLTNLEAHHLLSSFDAVPLLRIEKRDIFGNIIPFSEALDLNLVPYTSPYGYQGRWIPSQLDDLGCMVLSWQASHYVLSPEKRGDLISHLFNAQSFNAKQLKQHIFSHNLTSQRMNWDLVTNVWTAGLGGHVRTDYKCDVDNVDHTVYAYAIGLDQDLWEDFVFGGSVAKFITSTTSRTYNAKNNEEGYVGSLYAGLALRSCLVKACAIYSNIENNMITNYEFIGEAQGFFKTQGMYCSARLDYKSRWNIDNSIRSSKTSLVPFFEVEYLSMKREAFKEIGVEDRFFDPSENCEVRMPMGISIESNYVNGDRSEINNFSVTYTVDLYSKAESFVIGLIPANIYWNSIDLAKRNRHALQISYSNSIEWNSYFGTFMKASYEQQGLSNFERSFFENFDVMHCGLSAGFRLMF